MMQKVLSMLALVCVSLLSAADQAQGQTDFNLDAYKEFLQRNSDLTVERLMEQYPAGKFVKSLRLNYDNARFADLIDQQYRLTGYEKALTEQHGFMVSERLSYESFGQALLEIYKQDLPVYVSSDAIMHALHMSYSAILQDVERRVLTEHIAAALEAMHTALPAMRAQYADNESMLQSINDLDVYLAVPRALLEDGIQPAFSENQQTVQDLLAMIHAEKPRDYPLFGECPRTLDFSQFTPRGHYTSSEQLTRYFRAMMWVGRTEIYLLPPIAVGACNNEADITRQNIVAVLLTQLAQQSGAIDRLEAMDEILQRFVGPSDNVTLPNMRTLIAETGISDAAALLDDETRDMFRTTLRDKSYAFQAINSQILYSNPMDPTQIKPASAFLLLGQRFIIDSYVMGNVVYDQITFRDQKILRMLPSSLDVLFALGNDAAVHLLRDELEQYPYAHHLAGLRYLIDSYDPEFWNASIYAGWLNALRQLSPPESREGLPQFMQTAAWWQKKMNTQLASWSELRHDNLLYAKPSYSGGITCEFPKSYVEPIPEFYNALATFADETAAKFRELNLPQHPHFGAWTPITYFENFRNTMETLGSIAQKELDGESLTKDETTFLRRMLFDQDAGCAVEYHGWFADLHYTGEEGLFKNDRIVADVHTAPTDAQGNPVGWVVHVGTGPVNLSVVLAQDCNGASTAFVGPVMSYYEHTSVNFQRLTDEEWAAEYNENIALRPRWADLYLADAEGMPRNPEGAPTLITGAEVSTDVREVPQSQARVTSAYPNPAATVAYIGFSVPYHTAQASVELRIVNARGQMVRKLYTASLPSGNYSASWDLRSDAGKAVEQGVYFYELLVGSEKLTGKIIVSK